MRHCVVLDSCFVIATSDAQDVHHQDAINIFNTLLDEKVNVTIIIPLLVLYEVISVLIRKGFTPDESEKKIIALLRAPKVITLSLTETSAFRHGDKLLTASSPARALRGVDYMIASVGVDFEAQILTFDITMRNRLKPVYKNIYYCSSVGGAVDETSDFLNDLNLLS